MVVVLIIGAVAGFIIWKLKFSNKGEISKEEPKTEGESVPLKSQEPSGEDQKLDHPPTSKQLLKPREHACCQKDAETAKIESGGATSKYKALVLYPLSVKL